MTPQHRPGPQPSDLIRRLRAWSLSSWDATRVATARAGVQRLADLAADAVGQPRRPVPAIAPFAIADQLAVLRRDAFDAGAGEAAERELAGLARSLGW